MLRIILHEHFTGFDKTQHTYQTMDVDLPELENWLRLKDKGSPQYFHREVVGVEVLPEAKP